MNVRVVFPVEVELDMNRAKVVLYPLAAVFFLVSTLAGQTAGTRVDTGFPWAHFTVDGQDLVGSAHFTWPAGSQHILEIPPTQNFPPQNSITCTGWKDSNGVGQESNRITITANPSITTYTAECAATGRFILDFGDGLAATDNGVDCGTPGDPPPVPTPPGVVYVAGKCYLHSATIEASGTVQLAAYPYPGFVFRWWNLNGRVLDSYLTSVNIPDSSTLSVRFEPGKRVKFLTDPPALKVLVDRSDVLTPQTGEDPCVFPYYPPAGAPPYFSPRCIGVLDFADGSQHVLAAETQKDRTGNDWVFDSFSNGLGLNGVYKTTEVRRYDIVTAKFVPGAHVGVLTDPPGLKLSVDGRNNWPSYNFIWGIGTTHQIGAPAELTDSRGRKWAFKSWSQGGAANQEVTVPADAVTNAFRVTAKYEMMSRLRVESMPPGLTAQVDGVACATPCVIDRAGGTQVKLSLPPAIPITDLSRMELASWLDGATGAERTLTLSGETQTVVASYRTAYLLRAGVEPAAGASVAVDPPAADGYYPSGSQLMLKANARPGFRFRRWDGDLTTSSTVATLVMNSPVTVRAMLDRVPYIEPAGVRNAAGGPADAGVAPGSIISIYGASLGPSYEPGPANPLAQTLSGVTVRVNDRLLPLLFVSPEQINALLPSDLAEGLYYATVRWDGNPEVTAPFEAVRNAPGVFSRIIDEKAFVLALHADGSVVGPDSPARPGETISILGTGFGPYERRPPDGFAVPDSPAYPLADPLTVIAGDQRFDPVWSGAAAGYSGAAVTRWLVPSSLPASSTVELRVEVNGKASNTVLLPLE